MNLKNISIVDYGSGNIRSIINSVKKASSSYCSIKITKNPSEIIDSSHIIIPGVGSFQHCISSLKENSQILSAIKAIAQKKKSFILGICVGMQILATIGEEFGNREGLKLIPGKVKKISNNKIKLPHVGWNSINIKQQHPILTDINSSDDFYFTHSFYFKNDFSQHCLATTNYGDEFSSIVAKDRIVGTQFHPEKSGKNGLKLLSNFIDQKI